MFEFPISAEKSLSILVKTSEFLRFCASNPPPPKFSGSATVQEAIELWRQSAGRWAILYFFFFWKNDVQVYHFFVFFGEMICRI